jgi:hypothetical protein
MPLGDGRSPRKLVDILRALPTGELDSLISRLGISIVAAKRIDTPSQVARALVALPEVRDSSRLPNASAELLHRIAEARGSLLVQSIPMGLEPLAARGIVFARMRSVGDTPPPASHPAPSQTGRGSGSGAIELVLPAAYLVQLRSWEGEDPRGIRALLAQAPFETVSAIATHYLGRPATPPIALSLEVAWEVLSDTTKLTEEIEKLAPVERRLLEALEREGGEVDTEELLDLEREPMRLRGATGATPSRRGVGFALERRGLLIPVHPNRHIVPTEVALVVGAAHQAARETRRAQIRSFVLDTDHAPRRARFADDPVPLTLALALAIREPGVEVREGVGTPRSLVTRLAQRFGRDPEVVALIAALSRAIGLWDPSAMSSASPPGSSQMHELQRSLYTAWWRGGAWDEARPDSEILRLAPEARDSSPVGVIREMVLDALRELGEGRWVPWEAVAGYVRDDTRTAGVARLLRRWAERAGIEPPSPIDVAKRIALESLPALGAIDIGIIDIGNANPDDEEPAAEIGPTLRLTPRGRALLSGKHPTTEPIASRFIDSQVLRVGPQSRVAAVLGLQPLVEIGKVGGQIDLILTPASLARALSAGVEAEIVKARIESVAPMPDTLSRLIAQASVVVGRGTLVQSAGFLWIEDANVREMLRSRRQTADLFIDPSPPGGLLVHPTVDLERLARRCRALGIEIASDGQVVRSRSTIPPPSPTPPSSTASGRRPSTRPPPRDE